MANNANSWWAEETPKRDGTLNAYERYSIHRGDTLSPAQRTVSLILTILTVLTLMGAIVSVTTTGALARSEGPYDSVGHMPNTSAVLAGCGRIFEFNADPQHYGVFQYEDVTRQPSGQINIPVAPMVVPAYGFMVNNEPLNHDRRVLYVDEDPVPLEVIMRSLYAGVTVIWYQPDISVGALSFLRDLTNQWAERGVDVLAIPWRVESLGVPETIRTHDMPQERSFAFSSWSITQSCETLSAEAFEGFMNLVEEKSPSRPVDPPLAVLTEEGFLPNIRGEFSGVDIP